MTKEQIRRGIEELSPWFYRFEFGDGLETASAVPEGVVVTFESRRLMMDRAVTAHFGERLREIECLDIGCHEGFYSLAMSRRGVKKVAAVDARPENLRRARFVADAMGIDNIQYSL